MKLNSMQQPETSDIFTYWKNLAEQGDPQAITMIEDMNMATSKNTVISKHQIINQFILTHANKPYRYLIAFMFTSCMIAVIIEQWRFYVL